MNFLLTVLMALAIVLPSQAKTITLTTKNTITIDGVVGPGVIGDAFADLLTKHYARKSCKTPLYLVIDSPGGSVYYGNRFINYAKTVCNLHTITLFGASMASAIAMQLPGTRYATPTSEFMFHRARVEIGGQVESGELESRLKHVKNLIRHLEEKTAARIGISLHEYKQRVKDEWWVYGRDAIRQNVADEIVTVRCSKALATQKKKKTVRSFFGASTVEVSKCPLM